MNIESMPGYPGRLRVMRPPEDASIMQLQGQISALTKNIQESTLPKAGRLQVWCISCCTEGHLVTKCLRLRGARTSSNPVRSPPVGPSGGVVQVVATTPFHGHVPFCRNIHLL
jgi:hypothetical protein